MDWNVSGFRRARGATLIAMFIAMTLGSVALSQTKSDYKVGVVMDVKPHKAAAKEDNSVKRYDVTVKVQDVTYLVLVTPPDGSTVIEYKTGTDLPVRVDGNVMKFSDVMGRPYSAPILETRVTKKQNTP